MGGVEGIAVSTTPREPDAELRDAHLLAALRHAPDRDALPPPDLSARILASAREAAQPAVRRPAAAPWWQPLQDRLRAWNRLLAQPAAAGALATVAVATVVGLMWRSGAPVEREPYAATVHEAPAMAATSQPPAPAAAQDAAAAGGPPAASPAPAAEAPAPQGPEADAALRRRVDEQAQGNSDARRRPAPAPDAARAKSPAPAKAAVAPPAVVAAAPPAGPAVPSEVQAREARARGAAQDRLAAAPAPQSERADGPAGAGAAPGAGAVASAEQARAAKAAAPRREEAGFAPKELRQRQAEAAPPADAVAQAPAPPAVVAPAVPAPAPMAEPAAPMAAREPAATADRSAAAARELAKSFAAADSAPAAAQYLRAPAAPLAADPGDPSAGLLATLRAWPPSAVQLLLPPPTPLPQGARPVAPAAQAGAGVRDWLQQVAAAAQGRWQPVPAASLGDADGPAYTLVLGGMPAGRLMLQDRAALWLPQATPAQAWRAELDAATVLDLRARAPGR
jgi:hypothetical protein